MLIKKFKKLLPGGELAQQIQSTAVRCSSLTLEFNPRTYARQQERADGVSSVAGVHPHVVHLHTH